MRINEATSWSLLRAEHSNPENFRKTGLLRSEIPGNDEPLGGSL